MTRSAYNRVLVSVADDIAHFSLPHSCVQSFCANDSKIQKKSKKRHEAVEVKTKTRGGFVLYVFLCLVRCGKKI